MAKSVAPKVAEFLAEEVLAVVMPRKGQESRRVLRGLLGSGHLILQAAGKVVEQEQLFFGGLVSGLGELSGGRLENEISLLRGPGKKEWSLQEGPAFG